MKRLTLLRHAKTETAHSGQDDWNRELEPRGRQDAPEMARRLRERKLKPDRIITSPAVRALATAKIFAHELHLPAARLVEDERLYLASPKALREVVRELGDTAHHLMIVGHNPVLTGFYQRLRQAGKPPKVALTAVARKLLTILNAIIRSKTPWQHA